MPIAVSVKHGETFYHTSTVDALLDYMNCIDNTKKPFMYWLSDITLEILNVEDRMSVLNSKDNWSEADLTEYMGLKHRYMRLNQDQQNEDLASEPVEYTDEEALRDMTDLIAAITSGMKDAIPESEDQDLAHEVLDFIEMSISRRVN